MMNLTSTRGAALAILSATGWLSAQTDPPALDRAARLLERLPAEARVIDTQIDAQGTAWAAGPDYKIGVGADGLRFLPALGAQRPAAALLWRTEAIRRGSRLVATADTGEQSTTPRRIELRRGDVVEAYDVGVDGVEQSFVLHDRPSGGGDLEVVGVVDGELHPRAVEPRHGDLLFEDVAGRVVVRYGAAFAVDAAGRRTELATGCAGGRITIQVPAMTLDTAVYPLTIDPLINVEPNVARPYPIGRIALGTHGTGYLVVHEESRFAGDHDIMAWRFDAGFDNVQQVFAEVGATDSRAPVANGTFLAFAHGNSVQLVDTQTGTRKSYVANTPQDLQLSWHTYHQRLLLAFRDSGTLEFRLLDAALNYAGTYTEVGSFLGLALPRSVRGFFESWPVVYTAQSGLNTSRIGGFWLDSQFTTGYWVRGTFAPASLPGAYINDVAIDGSRGEYAIAYAVDGAPARLWAQRLSYGDFGTSPGPALWGTPRLVTATSGSTSRFDIEGLAFQHGTASHWALIYDTYTVWFADPALGTFVDLLGSEAEVVEHHTLKNASAYAADDQTAAVVWNGWSDPAQPFVLAYGDTVLGLPAIYTASLGFDPDARWTVFGSGCGPAEIRAFGAPWAGTHRAVDLLRAPSTLPVTVLVGFRSAMLPLDAIGMSGCTLNLDSGTLLGAFPVGHDFYNGLHRLELPPFVHRADVYFQYFYPWTGGNALQLGASAGLYLRSR